MEISYGRLIGLSHPNFGILHFLISLDVSILELYDSSYPTEKTKKKLLLANMCLSWDYNMQTGLIARKLWDFIIIIIIF